MAAGSPFTDVAEDAWCADAVTWASANGIVGGDGNGHLNSKGTATRAHVAQWASGIRQSPNCLKSSAVVPAPVSQI